VKALNSFKQRSNYSTFLPIHGSELCGNCNLLVLVFVLVLIGTDIKLSYDRQSIEFNVPCTQYIFGDELFMTHETPVKAEIGKFRGSAAEYFYSVYG